LKNGLVRRGRVLACAKAVVRLTQVTVYQRRSNGSHFLEEWLQTFRGKSVDTGTKVRVVPALDNVALVC